ncbi:MAG: energy-converting hydrogenase A subunit A EhaA [Methanobrevibacter sp.]|jgi:energy-converting hydrogenase A subunit A|nr:energy-converting hydrogenase A subunit A EhaA [Methanobrevibacter sp.]
MVISESHILLNYLIAIILSIVVAVVLKLPLVPEKPIRFSWTKSALFPTPIITIGILGFVYSLGFFWIYDGIILAVIICIISGLFVKYLFDYLFPKPLMWSDE